MKNPASSKSPSQPKDRIVVPRDPDVDDSADKSEPMPSPDTVNIRDEEYPSADKPLPPHSPIAATLHETPPRGHDQLTVGSAGDAARPSKTGIMNPTLPPRGEIRPRT